MRIFCLSCILPPFWTHLLVLIVFQRIFKKNFLYTDHDICEQRIFLFFSNLIFFSCLIGLDGTSSMMLNKSIENAHLWRKSSYFDHKVYIICIFSIDAFYQVETVPLYFQFVECQILSNAFPSLLIMVLCLFFIILIQFVIMIDFQMLNQPCVLGINLILSLAYFNMLPELWLLMFCRGFLHPYS